MCISVHCHQLFSLEMTKMDQYSSKEPFITHLPLLSEGGKKKATTHTQPTHRTQQLLCGLPITFWAIQKSNRDTLWVLVIVTTFMRLPFPVTPFNAHHFFPDSLQEKMYYMLWRSLVPASIRSNDQKLNSWQLPFHILPPTPETKTMINSTWCTECLQGGHLLNWLHNCPCESHLFSVSPKKFREIMKSTSDLLNLNLIFYATTHELVIPLISWKEKSRDFSHGEHSPHRAHTCSSIVTASLQTSNLCLQSWQKEKDSLEWIQDPLFHKKTTVSQELKCQACR